MSLGEGLAEQGQRKTVVAQVLFRAKNERKQKRAIKEWIYKRRICYNQPSKQIKQNVKHK